MRRSKPVTRQIITGIGELVTNRTGVPGELGIVRDAAVVVEDGRVSWVGLAADRPRGDFEIHDVEGRAVIPGYVDAHTHLVFAGERSGEFARRLDGEAYEEILADGGGIHSTVTATREASLEDLVATASARARRMLQMGTTTVEVKSGYGLTTADEVRLLEAARLVGEETGIGVVRTFLGAHVADPKVGHADYVNLVIEEMLPAAAPHAEFCDVFCDRGAFSIEDTRRILEAAAALELPGRIHAEQLTHSGGAALAAELGLASADHLDHVTEGEAAALAVDGVVAVLLPAASLSMRSTPAPGRMLWDAGVSVALATDCNPGTAYVESMALVIALACGELGLAANEAMWAATRGSALSLRRDDLGCLTPGSAADLVVLDADSYVSVPYRPGTNLAAQIMKNGEWVLEH